jgi:hypothetical protein
MAPPGTEYISYGSGLPNAGICCDAFLPDVSTSDSRVYFLDGVTTLRFLAPDGSTGIVTTLPNIRGKARAIFAVSPDDQRIAISLFDWSKRPMSDHIYVEDLSGGNRVEVLSSTSVYEWPVGWHAGKLVLAGGPSLGGSPNPYAADWYHLVDPSNGSRIAVLAGGDCPAVGPLSAGGTACVSSKCHCIEKVDWSGKRSPTYTYNDPSEFNAAALSVDGKVLFDEVYGAKTGTGIWRDGTITWLPDYSSFTRAQWLGDRNLLINGACPTSDNCLKIEHLVSHDAATVQASGEIAGVIPGGL